MAIIKSFAPFQNLTNFQVFENDTLSTSEYFRITELSETLTGGKNGFLIEGSEFLALKEFDFHRYRPKVIVVEYLDLSLPALEIKNLNVKSAINSDIYKLIASKNYTLINMLHSDLVFVNNNFRD